MADKLKALPNIFPQDQAIADIRSAIREIDVNSITALKDLTRAFNSQKKKIESLEREVKTSETNISDIETAVEQNTNELFTIQTIQNKILKEISNLENAFTSENRRLEKKIDDQTNEFKDDLKNIERRVAQGSDTSIIGSIGAKAAKAAPAAEAAVAKKTLASLLPSLAKGTMRAIGGTIAAFTTDIVSSLAEATGHPQIAAGADIMGDTIVGASLGSLFGPVGTALGGIAGLGYGAYDKGGQLLGTGEISPYIKELEQQANERTANRQQQQIEIEQLHQQKPELQSFQGGEAPQVVAGQTPTSQYTPSNSFFDAIIKAEGSAKHGNPYDASLGYMRSPKPLTQMTMAESLAWGDQIRAAQGLNSSAKGAFQIVNTTQRAAMKALGMKDTDLFNEENQRKMAAWIVKTQGLGAWEGFKVHPEQRQIAQQAMSSGLQNQTSAPSATLLGSSETSLPSIASMAGTTVSTGIPQSAPVGRTGVMGGSGMSFDPSQKKGGGAVPSGDIVALGKWLQSQGVNISEHPSFGGVLGTHAKNSAHYRGQAIDINGPPGMVEANDPVWGKRFDQLADQLTAAGYKVYWRESGKYGASGHNNHLHAQIGGGSPTSDAPSAYEKQAGIPAQAQQPPSDMPLIPQRMGAPIGASGLVGMEAQLMGNPMMPLSGMGIGGGMAGMIAGMVAPMLLNSLSSGPDLMSGQLQQQMPQAAQLMPPSIAEAPLTPYDEAVAEQPQSQVNNINVAGGHSGGASTALPQNQVAMNARPDWLGGLAEGLLGATYTGMSRPKYFGAGTGKM